ncbi:hypothetical protein ABBQ32_009337 [Trebouxia sp. C0010 RCD-2024]
MASSVASPPRSVPVPSYEPALDNAYSLGDLDTLMSDMHLRHSALGLPKAHSCSIDICGLHLLRSPEAASCINQAAFCGSNPLQELTSRSPSSAPVSNGRSWHPLNRGSSSRGKPRALFRDETRDTSHSPSGSANTRGRGSSATRGRGAYRGRGGLDPRRGQGHYRRLWAEVTKVGRGQKLGDGDGSFPDSSVEDMLQLVRGLAPDASAIAAISQGLYYLDSGALAALLKELAKSGHGKRAMEVFDWLRGLEDGHDLVCLCDVYTYTTMISQCGSHQQLRRALELVAEMRGRGVACNVHTYSALMNVCIKANELDLALDVYRQLLSDSCTPNLVTYNTLIDVYGKTGQWEEAVKVLDALEHQGIEPEIRTYNTVIIACNMSGQAQEALKVYERMLRAGADPTATTYTALISAYGKNGQLDRALQIFEDMLRRGCERNVITYSSLISACEKAGRWELALDLFSEMHREGCKPNVVTYNSLIAACAQGAQWEKAVELFEQMQAKGCKPDSVTYGGLILAFEKGDQWRRALAAFDQMKNNNCRPDSVVYNTVVGALWNTGVVWAQAKAVQVFQTACRQGHFRLTVHTSSESGTVDFGMHAFTVGAAVISLMRWLSELRERLPKDGPAMLRQQVCMTVNKGKPSREHAYPDIKAAITSLLQGCHSPFRLYDVACGCRIEGPAGGVADWLRGPELERAVAPYCKADLLRGLNRDVLLKEDASVEGRCSEAFAAVKRFEESHKVAAQSMCAEYVAGRKECVRLAMSHAAAFGFKDEVLHDAVLLVDRTMSSGTALPPTVLPLLVAACILISARQGARPLLFLMMLLLAVVLYCLYRGGFLTVSREH